MTKGRPRPLGSSRGLWALATAVVAGTVVLGAPAAAASKGTKAAKQFVSRLDGALRDGDVTYLVAHLDQAVLDRYGKSQCQTFLMSLGKNNRIKAKKFSGPTNYVYTTDNVSTTVPKVYSVTADVTIGTQTTPSTVHVTKSTWFTDCGTPSTSTDPVIAAVKRFEGHYTGRWNNQTFGSTGSVDLTITVDPTARVAHVTLALGGNVFGGRAPAPETYDLPLDATDPTKPIIVNSALLGRMNVALAPDGSLNVTAPSVPGGVVATFQAKVAPTATGMDGTYSLTFVAGGGANGTVTLTRG